MKLNNLLLAMSLASEPVTLCWYDQLGPNPELTNLKIGDVIPVDGVPGVSLAVNGYVKDCCGCGGTIHNYTFDIIIDNPQLEQ